MEGLEGHRGVGRRSGLGFVAVSFAWVATMGFAGDEVCDGGSAGLDLQGSGFAAVGLRGWGSRGSDFVAMGFARVTTVGCAGWGSQRWGSRQ